MAAHPRRPRRRRPRRAWFAGLALGVFAPFLSLGSQAAPQADSLGTTAAAEPRRLRFVLASAGVAEFDLSGTGTAPIFAARLGAELRRWLVAELTLNYFRPKEDFGRRRTYLLPDVQLQVQLPGGTVRPYVGAGFGSVSAFGEGTEFFAEYTLAGALGLRVVPRGLPVVLGTEVRLRGLGPFGSVIAEWTGGLGWRF